MMRSLFSGVAGLKTHQVKMDVIGNNIANVNTTSFKSQSITFSDLMYQTSQRASRATERVGGTNARQIGLGAKSGAIATAITQQGATETTNNPFDMRITGDAFYVVNNGNQTMFTRDGSFYVDGAGNLAMQSTGYFVYGWSAQEDPETGAITVNTNGGVGKLSIMTPENMTYPPEGTTEAVVSGNIDAHDTNITSDTGKTVSLEFYDNLGYLYTAKFAVRDVEGVEHAYTMTLDDILDSNGNTIGADKLSNVRFTNQANEEPITYNILDDHTKLINTTNYSAIVGQTYTTFKNASGSTAYTKVPTTGIIQDLNDSFPGFLYNVYGNEASGANATNYYEIAEDGSMTIYKVNPGTNATANLAPYYLARKTDSMFTYASPDGDTTSIAKTGNWADLADNSDPANPDPKKKVLQDMFMLTDANMTAIEALNEPSYVISNDGISKLTITGYVTGNKTYDTNNVVITSNGLSKAYIKIGTGAKKEIKKEGSITDLTSDIRQALGLDGNEFNTSSARYTIDTENTPPTVSYKYPDTTVDIGPFENDRIYAVDKKNAPAGSILFRNLKTDKTVTVSESGTVGSLGSSVKGILEAVYGYVPSDDDVTYSLTGNGANFQVGVKDNSDIGGPYGITVSTKELNILVETPPQMTETTATFINQTDDSKLYENIPRSGYVSELYDATLTHDFFEDVYGYTPDAGATDYENLTYNILENGTLQIIKNYIGMTYNEKTGAIETPTEKITLQFIKDSLIENDVDLMGGFTNVNLDLSTTTNYNTMATSTIGAVKGDKDSLKTGRAVGEMNGVTISKDGSIYATYSNGQTKLLGQIATAEFANASGLEKNGDNLYTQTLNSGEATIQDVTTDGGYITTGVLEMSNVDLSSEFTSMITTQRGFQANSRIITVSDTLLEELTNLKR
ncbi:flagellar hook-basal body complex protein [Butyrivibrio sp. WCE2006]|uniref:flagellar hook-basal body complex protein n=1 Tax=Butyrivibrio sp. WCE2006 TaxID=1410611 RepID=UPI0006798FB6|nr:flagellar hook-basal body complex protein [Butyrivibrio sp. WCE2006]